MSFDPVLHPRASRFAIVRGYEVELTERDLDVLYELFIHGYLTSEKLRAKVSPGTSQTRFTDRLKELKREPNLYVTQPVQQQDEGQRNANYLVFDITDAGIQALLDAERIEPRHVRWRKGVFSNRNHYKHEVMASDTSISIALAAQERGLDYASWLDIIDSPFCPAATKALKNPLAIATEIGGKKHTIITDGICGVFNPARGEFDFYAKEDDRNSTPRDGEDIKTTSLMSHVRDWRHVIGTGLHQKHFGIDNVQVMILCVASMRMQRCIDQLAEEAKDRAKGMSGARPFLFQAVPQYGRIRREIKAFVPKDLRPKRVPPPVAKDAIFSGKWKRVGENDVQLTT